MKTFVLIHRHTAAECAIAYAAWRGFDSPLRGGTVQSTCARHPPHRAGAPGDTPVHEIWWTAHAADERTALQQLPPYVSERSEAREVTEVRIA